MAREIRHFTATIPANTPLASPVTVNIAMPVRTVSQIDWRVPNGPLGMMGWQLAMGGVRVLPDHDQFLVANGESGTWHVDDQPDSGAWQVIGYNTGAHAHAVYIAMHCDPPVRIIAPPAPLPALGLMPAPDLSMAGPPVRRRM